MSWLPDKDPVLGDKHSCDALELAIIPRVRMPPSATSGKVAASKCSNRGAISSCSCGNAIQLWMPNMPPPVGMVSEWFYAEVMLEAGASAPLDADHEERAIYVTEGEVEIAGDKFEAPQLLIFRPGDRITVKTLQPTRMMFLGGDALEGPRHIWWNFVSSSKERIEQAKDDWKTGRFAPVPQEHEFIPLPE